MATVKLTAQRGKPYSKDVAVAAGTAEAQTETISLNIDYTAMTRGETLLVLEAISQKIHGAHTWPPQ